MKRQSYKQGATAKIDVRLPPELKRRLRTRAGSQGVTMSRLVVDTIREVMSAPNMRRVCSWFHDEIPIDGRGPVPDGAEKSHGMCDACYERASKERLDG